MNRVVRRFTTARNDAISTVSACPGQPRPSVAAPPRENAGADIAIATMPVATAASPVRRRHIVRRAWRGSARRASQGDDDLGRGGAGPDGAGDRDRSAQLLHEAPQPKHIRISHETARDPQPRRPRGPGLLHEVVERRWARRRSPSVATSISPQAGIGRDDRRRPADRARTGTHRAARSPWRRKLAGARRRAARCRRDRGTDCGGGLAGGAALRPLAAARCRDPPRQEARRQQGVSRSGLHRTRNRGRGAPHRGVERLGGRGGAALERQELGRRQCPAQDGSGTGRGTGTARTGQSRRPRRRAWRRWRHRGRLRRGIYPLYRRGAELHAQIRHRRRERRGIRDGRGTGGRNGDRAGQQGQGRRDRGVRRGHRCQ